MHVHVCVLLLLVVVVLVVAVVVGGGYGGGRKLEVAGEEAAVCEQQQTLALVVQATDCAGKNNANQCISHVEERARRSGDRTLF